ncbi:glycosyltransferase [Daejeonella oryzae]|uniref:glycosyltransferase n=1 Tax=Daejeonella oryzae TaxID=1122943 RepID=UPI00047A4C8D|nr:glycosyltransferase [Daejeonella oryzae]
MELKRVLIISPYFPPSNAADMQRIRMSLPYFKEFGWEAEVVTVYFRHSEMVKDELFLESIPPETIIHYVDAFSKRWTGKFGLGSLALRSLWHYKQKVNNLLKSKKFDLIYFSTTQFPLCILGAYWKKRFGIPYVIDMQDPWHSEYYQDKPKNERPKKYWFSYRLNKYLEPIAMRNVNGIISVSESYIKKLTQRYKNITSIPTSVIPFGAYNKDFEITIIHKADLKPAFNKNKDFIHLVYIGRGGYDMHDAIKLLFNAFKKGLGDFPDQFQRIRFHFIGTSYAPKGEGKRTIYPLANELGISTYVEEQTDRISFYRSIRTLLEADALIVPGSNDPQYTASKIYPYILAKKPLIGIFNSLSSSSKIIQDCNAGIVSDLTDEKKATEEIFSFLHNTTLLKKQINLTDWSKFSEFSAESMTMKQCELFNKTLTSYQSSR